MSMLQPLKLFMLLLGCKPDQRNTEQHDIFFGIGPELKDLVPDIFRFWPEANRKIHIDAWREVTLVDDYAIQVVPSPSETEKNFTVQTKLFFINLGGYKPGEFEEYHYRLLVAANSKEKAIRQSRQTAFYRHTGFGGAPSHIDEKYGVDVDDVYEIKDILPKPIKEKYSIRVSELENDEPDQWHLGYTQLHKL